MKHILLRNPRLSGIQYGMLRCMEDEIVRQTGAEVIDVPTYTFSSVQRRMGHGMRWDRFRSFLPRESFTVKADVIWCILMGPENYELDLFKHWHLKAKTRIVYLFDTLEEQFDSIKKLFSSDHFNIHITSFRDAVPTLEQMTNRKWYAVEQAVPTDIFTIPPGHDRLIHFSSYGRKLGSFHEVMSEFAATHGLYYDFSTQSGQQMTATPLEAYKQYAWHLGHSMFTISWPVELTNPVRAGRLNPITCRWFEAASVGTIMIGQPPNNADFEKLLVPDLVQRIDPFAEKTEIFRQLEKCFDQRASLMAHGQRIAEENAHRWSWRERISRIRQWIPN